MLGNNWESEKLVKFARAVWELISQAALLSDFLTISASPILVFSPVDSRLSIWTEFTVSAMKVALVWGPKIRPNEAAQSRRVGLRVMAAIIRISTLSPGVLSTPGTFHIWESRVEESTEARVHVESFLFPGHADQSVFTSLCLFPRQYSGDVSVPALW